MRYLNPAGEHESSLIGENPNGVPNNLMPYIAQVAAGKDFELNVFSNDYSTPDETGTSEYIHVMDLVRGILMYWIFSKRLPFGMVSISVQGKAAAC